MWLRCAPRLCQTCERCALCDIWPATALAPSQRMCTCSPLTLNCARLFAAVPSGLDRYHHHHRRQGRSRLLRCRQLFFDVSVLLSTGHCCCCCRGSLPGSVELQVGVQGGSDGAAAQWLSSGSSGGPPARLRRLWRRRAARLLAAGCVHCVCKKSAERHCVFLGLCVRLCVSHAQI